VNSKEGRNLAVVQLVGTQDPFCEVKCGKENFKTKVHDDGGTKPKWNQSFIFNIDGTDDAIHFLVKNKNLLSDANIGRADVPLEKFAAAEGDTWYQLVDVDAFKKTAGDVLVSVSFAGTGLPQKAQPAAAAQPQAQAARPVQQVVQQPQVQYVQQPQQPQVVYVQQQQRPPQVVYQQQPQVVYQQQPQVVYQQQPQVVYQQQPQVVYQQYPNQQNPTY